MRLRPWIAVLLAATLAACGTPRVPLTAPPASAGAARSAADVPHDGEVYPNGNHYRVMAVQELPLVGASADSSASGYPASNLIDGDLSTQWANGGYKNATAWAAVQLSGSASLGSIGVKMPPSAAGTSYDVQVSQDGSTWNTVLTGQTNTTWGIETKTLPVGTNGAWVRIFWHNSASNPQPHFSIFELEVNGGAGPAPSPTPTPSTNPSPTPTPVPTPTPSPIGSPGPLQKLTPLSATATSSYNGLTPDRAIDGDPNTQWAAGDTTSNDESLTLDYGQTYGFDHVDIKTGYLPPQVRYWIEASNDGNTWTAIGGGFTNTSWSLETKQVSGEGRYLRVHFSDYANYLPHVQVFAIDVYGKANATATSKTLTVVGGQDETVLGSYVGINATWEPFVNVQGTAYNDTPNGKVFPAMLGVDLGREGYTYARVTQQNAGDWYADFGDPAPVTFLDSVGGTADNSGGWTFTLQDTSGLYFPVVADATKTVTLWDPAKAAFVDLGSTPRTWRVDGAYAPNSPYPTGYAGIILVYTRPDGVRDFTIAQGAGPLTTLGPTTIDAVGYAYAFYMVENAGDSKDATSVVTLTAEN